MKVYFALIKNAFQSNIAYRMNVFLTVLSRIIMLFIQISLWKALYGNSQLVSSDMGNISLDEMISYTLISTGISLFIKNSIIGSINSRINSGQIAMDLIKPIKLDISLLCESMGNSFYKILFEFLPVLIIALTFFNIQGIQLKFLLPFLITLMNGFIIYLLITYIIGLLAFWYFSVGHLDSLLQDVTRLLSGSFIPLWFFPKALINISEYLPFKLIYFTPISIYLGKVDFNNIYLLVFQQICWIIVLAIIQKVLWMKAFKKLVIQGG